MRTVFFGLLRHQTDVRHRTHSGGVEVAVGFTEVDDLLVNTCKGALRNQSLGIFRLAVRTPHLAADADHGGHRRVNNHVVGSMQIRDAFG